MQRGSQCYESQIKLKEAQQNVVSDSEMQSYLGLSLEYK